MRLLILILLCAASLSGCGDDDSDCDKIADQIKARAGGDPDLVAMGRQSNPCAEPIAVTKTDYRAACEELRKCLDD